MAKTILLVDDVYANRYLVEGALAGYNVISAANGKEMWNLMRTNKPDLIIMDIMLPNEDGLSLAKKLHEDATFSKIPVIFLTAKHTSKEDVVESINAGGHGIIMKPFDPDELAARVEATLEKAK
jgi:DNA-binding response OmpR family regulator